MTASDRVTARKSLPMSDRDLRDLALMRGSERHREALARLSDMVVTESTSEAALLRAVWEAGIRAVEREIEADGYAKIALEIDVDALRKSARRRRPSWAEE
jgi:hypothetical protein